MANSRRRRNKIEALRNEEGDWEYDEKKIRDMGSSFFEKLYEDAGAASSYLSFGMSFPTLTDSDILMLGRDISHLEVKQALFAMGPLKAAGPDS